MADGFLIVDEKDWCDATQSQKDWMIFKTLRSINDRLIMLERRQVWDRALSATGGAIGGAIAAVGIRLFS